MKNRKNIIIVVMVAVALLMATGYAYFATQLNINATGSITSNWNVYFSSINVGKIVGTGSNKVTPSVSGTTANMEANLAVPGDSITYEITLLNAGTVGAIVEDIKAEATGSSGIIFTIEGIGKGDKISGGDSKVITVKIEYDSSITDQPTETSKSLTITLDCVQDIGQTIESEDVVIDEEKVFTAAILQNNTVQSDDGIDFSKISSDTNGKGLYSTTTDSGTVYYFRGDVSNNYVKFGTYQKDDNVYYVSPINAWPFPHSTYEECMQSATSYGGTSCTTYGGSQGDDMYWRIVRINEDGTVKLVYAGTNPDATTGRLAEWANDGAIYENNSVDYTSKAMKSKLETWYTNHLESIYGSYIADNNFCNDTEISKTENSTTYYKGYDRVIGYNPTYNCSSSSSLSVSNGKLSKPIGTLTADEVMYAGGVIDTENTSYYLKYVDSVTMTPSLMPETPIPLIYSVDDGMLTTIINNGNITDEFVGLNPVINISASALVTGNGTTTSPYVIKTN